MESIEQKKIGPLLLSGLMIGPILGSGIIILPPLIYGVAGDWAIFSWLLMAGLGFLFAVVFGKLSILFPGEAGVAAAIECAFGSNVKNLTCFYLIGAVLFGPIAVILTAAEYLLPDAPTYSTLAGFFLVFCCVCFLLFRISVIGLISLIASSLCAAVLFSGGILTLLFYRKDSIDLHNFSGNEFGYGLLLLFWTIVGWEVIGSYSGEVKNPRKSIMRAVYFSAAVIALVSLTVSGAVQMADPLLLAGGKLQVTAIIVPVFGRHAVFLMSAVVLSLCVTTYLLFVGGVARLVASLAENGVLPFFLGKKNSRGAPVAAVALFGGTHIAVLASAMAGVFTIETLVALADGFFIANAFIGLAAAFKLLEARLLRGVSFLLCISFAGIFMQSSLPVIGIVVLMALYFNGKGLCSGSLLGDNVSAARSEGKIPRVR